MPWELTGNTGTNPTTNFLGTYGDNPPQPLVIKTGGTERLRVAANGNVGIGTAAPGHPLHIATGKVLRIEAGTGATDTTDYFSFGGNGSFGIDAPGVPDGRFVVQNSGNVGIGTPNPNSKLEVNGNLAVTGNGSLTVSASAPGALGPVIALTNTSGGVNAAAAIDFYTFDPGQGVGPDHLTSPSSRIEAIDDGNFANDIVFLSNRPGAPNNPLVEQMRITSAGNVTVPGDIILAGADCAEQFDVSEAVVPEPGTVLVIDEGGALRESCQPYDKKVAGVVSGAGDYRHGILLDRKSESSDRRVAVALVGKVFCKVDAQYFPVEVGDLLTTSQTPGYAMKAMDRAKAFGSAIGKALKPLEGGRGLIPILIALQ